MAAVTDVRGMGAAMQQAQAGMKLFEGTETAAAQLDIEAAAKYKADIEKRIEALEAEAAKLTGKDNKKERAAKGKEVSELKGEPRYVDACKIGKGLEPKHGNFVSNLAEIAAAAAKAEAAKAAAEAEAQAQEQALSDKKKKDAAKPAVKKQDGAGISPAETKELEKLKVDIVERKAQLKAEGLSGGQQNKDAQIVEWVNRMNELKEKQEPGSTQKDTKKKDSKKSKAPLSSEEQRDMDKLVGEIEVYKHKLRTEFGYSNKEMKADPDLAEMESALAAYEKRS